MDADQALLFQRRLPEGASVARLGKCSRSATRLRARIFRMVDQQPTTTPEGEARLAEPADAFRRRVPTGLAPERALELLVRTMDLTTLEGSDTPARIRRLCARALSPAPGSGPVAAVCVYPVFVAVAKEILADSPVRVASVAGAFPSGQSFLATRLDELGRTLEAGADEIDVPLNRGALLAGDEDGVRAEIAQMKALCGSIELKVILEIGELGDPATVRRAAELAIEGGADFLKTSTGKLPDAATLAGCGVLLDVIREHERATGRRIGLKPAGGIRTAADALGYVALVQARVGDAWLTPQRLRFGASSLLDDVVERWSRTSA